MGRDQEDKIFGRTKYVQKHVRSVRGPLKPTYVQFERACLSDDCEVGDNIYYFMVYFRPDEKRIVTIITFEPLRLVKLNFDSR